MRRCLDCPRLIPTGSRCPVHQSQRNRKRNRLSYYQTAEWRRLRKTIDGLPCVLNNDECDGPINAHHVHGRREGGPDTAENLIPLCHRHHNWYEADHRAGRSTDLTRLIESIRPNQEGLFD